MKELAQVFYAGDLERNPYFGSAALETARAGVKDHPKDPVRLSRLATELLEAGRNEEAWEACGRARKLAEAEPPYPGFDTHILWRQALSAMRKAEADNCVALHSPESCIYPLQGRAVHVSKRGAELAQEHLLEHLKLADADSLETWRSRWLLNVASMALESWPESVPPEHRVPGDPFGPPAGVLKRFPNDADAAGVQGPWKAGGSVVVDDFDGDGHLDVITCGWLPTAPMHVYRGDGRGGFRDVSGSCGLEEQVGGIDLQQADYDNDGDLDLFVVRGGQPDPEETFEADDGRRARNSLLRNRGDGTFEDVTLAAGLGGELAPWSAAAWSDFDGDGHVDLYVAVQGDDTRYPDRLYKNQGDGTFGDVARSVGIDNARHAMSAVWGDFDGDGDPDLFIANYGATDRLYRNQDGRFVDYAPKLRLSGQARSHGAWWIDANGDGRLDLLVSSWGADPGESAASLFGQTRGGPRTRLYLNRFPLAFQEVGEAWGLDTVVLAWSGNVGDLDGDGLEDVYLGTGGIGFDALTPNVVWRNAGDRFADETLASGMGHLQKASAVAFGDVDGDGDRDVLLRAGGCYPADAFINALFRNPGHGARWVTLILEGKTANRAAIGAQVSVRVATAGGERTLHRWVGSGGSFGASTLRVELGLGDATRVLDLRVRWPGGAEEAFTGAELDRAFRLVEGSGVCR